MADKLVDLGGWGTVRLKDMGDGTFATVIAVASAPPAAANILTGRATANGGTVITVPAGRIWRGTVALSAALATAAATAGATATPTVSTAGAGVTPAAGAVLGLALATGGGVATGTVGTNAQNSVAAPLTVIAPAGNAVTLTLQTGGATVASASAVGELV